MHAVSRAVKQLRQALMYELSHSPKCIYFIACAEWRKNHLAVKATRRTLSVNRLLPPHVCSNTHRLHTNRKRVRNLQPM